MKPAGLLTDVALARFTTLGLGGRAAFFLECDTVETLRSGLLFAHDRKVSVTPLAGGSNVIVRDEGFNGLVLKISFDGVRFYKEGSDTCVSAAAGIVWDDLVRDCTKRGLGGIECLSGIPGSVGAVPIQNVGAYGQEVRETIVSVRCLDRVSLEEVVFGNEDCRFAYRNSRFKTEDRDRYVVTEVTFRLQENATPLVRYAELREHLEDSGSEVSLATVREAVLAIRRRKSMIADPDDPDARSVGSFFVNPVLADRGLPAFYERCGKLGKTDIPTFPVEGGLKVSAAWLVEQAGFSKGLRAGGVGISSKHCLALVNHNGTATELLDLAREIEEQVEHLFGVPLLREPVLL